jgi:hypothetical protein
VFYSKKKQKQTKIDLSVRFLSTVNRSIECINNKEKKSSMRMIWLMKYLHEKRSYNELFNQ